MRKSITRGTVLPLFGVFRLTFGHPVALYPAPGAGHGCRTLGLIMVADFAAFMTDNSFTLASNMSSHVTIPTERAKHLLTIDGVPQFGVGDSEIPAFATKFDKFIGVIVDLVPRKGLGFLLATPAACFTFPCFFHLHRDEMREMREQVLVRLEDGGWGSDEMG